MPNVLNPLMDQGRVSFLQTKLNSSSRKGLLPAWPRTERELPVVDLQVEWVRLSTLNHRTRAEQLREVARTAQQDLFTNDPLGTAAQNAQYNILKGQTGFETLKTDLAERRQQEHAIVTAEGVLINGNRRTAALRSLLLDDKNLDARYVSCLVLPADATPTELVHLETELQVAKDFKEAYSWVNQALLIEELYNANGRNLELVAAMMHRPGKEITSDFEKIQQVNQLVDLSNGRWLHVDFEPNESAFDELAQYIRNKNDDEKEAVRSVYFLGTLTGVNYRDLRHLRRSDCREMVEVEFTGDPHIAPLLQLAAAGTDSAANQDDQLLNSVLGNANIPSKVTQVLDLLARHDRNAPVTFNDGTVADLQHVLEQVANAVQKAAAEAEEQKKDLATVTAPSNRLESAIQNMERARDVLARARAVPGWDEQRFRSLIETARTLLEELDQDLE